MRVRLKLDTGWSRAVLLCTASLSVLLLAGSALKVVVVSTLLTLGDESSLQTALQLDPTNDRLHRALGALYRWSALNPAKAVVEYRRAAELRPGYAPNLADLGDACDAVGDLRCAGAAFVRVAQLASMTPQLQWRIANHELLNSHPPAALRRLARFVELDPPEAQAAFAIALRASGDPQALWRELQRQPDAAARFRYITFLSANRHAEQAQRYWAQLTETGAAPTLPDAADYVNQLLAASQFDEARQVWSDLERLKVVGASRPGNLVYNGDFMADPLGTGFDWRLENQAYIGLAFDSGTDAGRRSLRVDFLAGTNRDFELAQQLVAVTPNQRYVLRADVRSQGISSDSGPRLRLREANCPSCAEVSTASTTGTSAWHRIETTFTAGPQTQALWLSLWRAQSRSFPGEIGGQFWLSNVTLTPLDDAGVVARQ